MPPSFRNCVAANQLRIHCALQQCVLCTGQVEPFGMPVTRAASESRCVPSSGTILCKHLEAKQMCNDTTTVQSYDRPYANATPCRSAHGPRMSHRRCPDQRRQARHAGQAQPANAIFYYLVLTLLTGLSVACQLAQTTRYVYFAYCRSCFIMSTN